MSVDSYEDLRSHIGHDIKCVCYGKEGDTDPVNVSVECETCNLVLMDFDKTNPGEEVTVPLTLTRAEWVELANSARTKADAVGQGDYGDCMEHPPPAVCDCNERWEMDLRSAHDKVHEACAKSGVVT